MLPITPSATRAATAPRYTASRGFRNWRAASEDIALFALLANLIWALALLVLMVLR